MFTTSPTKWFYGTVDITVDQYKPKLNLQITQRYQNPFGLKIKHEHRERWTRSLICNLEVSCNDTVTENYQLMLLCMVKLFSNSKCLSAFPLL